MLLILRSFLEDHQSWTQATSSVKYLIPAHPMHPEKKASRCSRYNYAYHDVLNAWMVRVGKF